MAIPLDDLHDMLTRSRRASGTSLNAPSGQVAAWRSFGGQACPSMWNQMRSIRKICAAEGDIAYFPQGVTDRTQADMLFTAAARQDLPRLLVERRILRARLRERRLAFQSALRLDEGQVWTYCHQATPEPWFEGYAKAIDPEIYERDLDLQVVRLVGGGDVCHVHPARAGDGRCDARFIATARWAVPRLAADLLAMREVLAPVLAKEDE